MSSGFQILPSVRSLPDRVLAAYQQFPTTLISDAMERIWAVSGEIRPLSEHGIMVGRALTVKTRPTDNLIVHKAVNLCAPGDVIVVDGGGVTTHALMGEIMVRVARRQGCVRVVIDGAVRDSDGIRALGFPVYARGITYRGPFRDGPGAINVPVQVGGAIVHPGDLIVGDGDGVVVVPRNEAESLIPRIEKALRNEEKVLEAIEAGTLDRSWVDDLLARGGYQGE